MRRFFLFCLLVACFLCSGFLKDASLSISSKGIEKVNDLISVVISSTNRLTDIDLEDYYHQTLNLKNDQITLSQITEQLDLEIITDKVIEDRKIITGYSPKLMKFVYLGGERINVQISISTDDVRIGYPLILGSF